RVCAITGEKWFMDEEEIGWYKKFNVPPSKLAPNTRTKLIMGFASGVAIWKKPHAKTGKTILSFIHPDSPFQVITDKEFFDEDFSNTDFNWDASRSFFEQIKNLALSVPFGALRDNGTNQNTIGVDLIDVLDSRLCFGGMKSKGVIYASVFGSLENCVDVVIANDCLNSWRLVRSQFLHRCFYCVESSRCINSSFLFDCDDCEFCFGATNQRRKKYLFFNEQLSKDEWEKQVSEIDLSCSSVFEKYRARFYELLSQAVWQENFFVGSINSNGQYLEKCVDCRKCYRSWLSTDLYYCTISGEQKTSAFSGWLGWGSNIYYSCDIMAGENNKFCHRVFNSLNNEYCLNCYHIENCFGCVGLKRKKFHIFNVPYSENEYWQKVDEIKCAMLERGEYGEFFPADFSEPGFQYSLGEETFGYSESDLKNFGAPKYDPERGGVVGIDSIKKEAIRINQIPDCLKEIDSDKFVGQPILDEKLNRHYSVTPAEFEFYKQNNLPFPREHFLTRLKNLFAHVNTPFFTEANCECGQSIQVYHNRTFPHRRVLCNACYLAHLEKR
ncbi:MAG: hypothetical protein ACD_76C00090G0002, partial [uncultured bacterium]